MESKRPESDVTVWGTASLFFHVTVVPALAASVEGVNVKFCMLTLLVTAGEVVAAGVAVVPAVDCVPGDSTAGERAGTALEPFRVKR